MKMQSEDLNAIRLEYHQYRKTINNKAALEAFSHAGNLEKAGGCVIDIAGLVRRDMSQKQRGVIDTQDASLIRAINALSECVSLLANCAFIDPLCVLKLKYAKIIHDLADIMSYFRDQEKMTLLATSIVRLLSNLVQIRDCAVALFQVHHAVTIILQICDSPGASGKCKEHVLRFARTFASNGPQFVKGLLKNGIMYTIAANCNPTADARLQLKTLQTLEGIARVAYKDPIFVQGTIETQYVNYLLRLVSQPPQSREGKDLQDLALQIILLFADHSDLRILVCKEGFVGTLNGWLLAWRNNCEQAAKPPLEKSPCFQLLAKLCKEGYIRGLVRDAGLLDFLVATFTGAAEEAKEMSQERLSCLEILLTFEYDDRVINYLLSHQPFVAAVFEILDAYTAANPCEHKHYDQLMSASPDAGEQNLGNLDERGAAASPDEQISYRADSPSYVQLLDESRPSVGGEEMPPSGPFCKDFLQHWNSMEQPPAARVSPGCSPTGSSPGPLWSHSPSRRSDSSDSESRFGPRWNQSSAASDRSFGYSSVGSGGQKGAWENHSGGSDVMALFADGPDENGCNGCSKADADKNAEGRKELVDRALGMLSLMSQKDSNCTILVSTKYMEIMLRYIGFTCSPNPRVGRILKRLVRNPQFLDFLLMEFKLLVRMRELVCKPRCAVTPVSEQDPDEAQSVCARCRKLCRIGCGILTSFRAQVDSTYGLELLARLLRSPDFAVKFDAACTAAESIASIGGKKKTMYEFKGLELLFGILEQSKDRDELLRAARAVKAVSCSGNRHCRRWSVNFRAPLNAQGPCKLNSENRPNSEADSSDGVKIIFSSGRIIEASKRVLCEKSENFAGMFSGAFLESHLAEIRVQDVGVTDVSYEVFVHYLSGCENCAIFAAIGFAEILQLFDLANRHQLRKLSMFLVDRFVQRFLSLENIVDFVHAGLLYGLNELTEMSLRWLILDATPEKIVEIIVYFRELGNLGEFMLFLTKFVKTCV